MKFIVEINGKKCRVSMGEYLFLKADINDQILRRLESIENKLNKITDHAAENDADERKDPGDDGVEKLGVGRFTGA